MAHKPWFTTRVTFEWSILTASVIAVVQGGGTLAKWSTAAILILGGLAACIAVFELKWYRAPVPIGVPIKVVILLLVIGGSMGTLGYFTWPKPPAIADDSMVQFDRAEFHFSKNDLLPHQKLFINYFYSNVGGRPAFDVQSWGALGAFDPNKTTNSHLHDIMDKGVEDGQANFAKEGAELGVGKQMWGSAYISPELDQGTIDNLNVGKYKLYLLAFGTWTNQNGQQFRWKACQWVDWSLIHTGDPTPVHVC